MISGPLNILRRYAGKSSDATTAVVSMLLGQSQSALAMNHAACLTGRPYAIRVVSAESKQWLVPWRSPWEGLLAALTATGNTPLRSQCGVDAAVLLDIGLEWIQTGPIVVGPLDPLTLWDRLEARFYGGICHFLVVLDQVGDQLFVHDPEGLPGGLVRRDKVERALRCGHPKRGILQLHNVRHEITEPVLALSLSVSDGAAIRRQYREDDSFGERGLRNLSVALSKRPLSSAESASLSYGLPALSMGRFLIATMLADLAEILPEWRETSMRAAAHADLISRTTALANRARSENNDDYVARGLERLAEVEADLDGILEDAPCS